MVGDGQVVETKRLAFARDPRHDFRRRKRTAVRQVEAELHENPPTAHARKRRPARTVPRRTEGSETKVASLGNCAEIIGAKPVRAAACSSWRGPGSCAASLRDRAGRGS